MRWSIAFAYLSAALVVTLLLSLLLGWTGWLLLAAILLLAPAVVGLAIGSRQSVSWSAVLSYLSAVALLAAMVSQYTGWITERNWLLLAWTILLLAPAVTLFTHPMRGPSWGLFVGFWGVVSVVLLIVLQALRVADVLGGSVYGQWVALPLAVIGIWLLVASASGFGAEGFPVPVDVLGIITGTGFLVSSVATSVGLPDVMRAALVVSAAAYCLWAVAFGWVTWSIERPSRRLRSVTAQLET